jgi:transcription elongation factor Elf1
MQFLFPLVFFMQFRFAKLRKENKRKQKLSPMTAKYFTCKSCHENTKVKSMATDRVEMERDLGETFLAECGHCHDRKTIHVNDVNAAPNKVITGIGAVAGVIAVAAL